MSTIQSENSTAATFDVQLLKLGQIINLSSIVRLLQLYFYSKFRLTGLNFFWYSDTCSLRG